MEGMEHRAEQLQYVANKPEVYVAPSLRADSEASSDDELSEVYNGDDDSEGPSADEESVYDEKLRTGILAISVTVDPGRKRLYEESGLQSTDDESVLKKRKPIITLNSIDSSLNSPTAFASDSKDSHRRAEQAEGHEHERGIGESSAIVPFRPATTPSKTNQSSNKHWPKLQGSEAFALALVSEQRKELTNYMHDLMAYSGIIQAGAIPVGFVSKFFKRLDTHFNQMDTKLDQVEVLHRREAARKAQLSRLQVEAASDHQDTQSLLNEFDLPSCRLR
ncbi:hypothetical protein LTR70_008610 [Exophiala xenobiotica]|uniref:Uncharacterized protein n=1 Tax=Lithohypha guttulata TaxID=1690604 RepID=A0ABR0K0E5_9EURO|nr:hypothetical protein LTR24_008319 [Lithohypha guttulata]KAK5311751.1 hypothetical protein LTR70_008610 [Exophiala xenobiotica]